MASSSLLCSLLLLAAVLSANAAAGAAGKCTTEDLVVQQRQTSRGLHTRWRVEIRNKCAGCEASMVELRCPGWVEGKAIEGYMYPMELVEPGVCMLGDTITAQQPFSTVYRQPAGKIELTVASARFHCPSSSSSSATQP